MAEIVQHSKTGLLFTPGDATDLADKMEWALDHPEEFADMGRRARAEFEIKYTAERNYQLLCDIYQGVLDGASSQHRGRRDSVEADLITGRQGPSTMPAAQSFSSLCRAGSQRQLPSALSKNLCAERETVGGVGGDGGQPRGARKLYHLR
jgi:hypothetical protein